MKSVKAQLAPRPGFQRNAGLRPRLVLIVGVAMLAPGALAVLQAISSFNSSLRILEENLAQAAQLSASEEVNIIAASREILTSLSAHPDVRRAGSGACRRALQRAIGGLDQYVGAVVVDRAGLLACSATPLAAGLTVSGERWFSDLMSGERFVVSDLLANDWLGRWGIVTAVPLMDPQGDRAGAVALFLGLDWLAHRYRHGEARGVAFALLDSRGEIIVGDEARAPLPEQALVREQLRGPLSEHHTRTFRARGHDNTWRLYAISALLGGRIYVILGEPVLTAIGPLALQVAWGVFAPLLMWALGIAVVWFGIEHLVVRWITYLERITSAYAAGRHNVRPERVMAAPAEIRSLGETFSRMADLISAREAELRESLAQKEILVREIHHRVKNNLQLVMSLLNLHARRIRDPRAEVAFAEARSRINALATLHRRLYESESLQQIDLKWFLDDLCCELRRGGLSRGREVELAVVCCSEVIGPEVAVPLGLLVTEAITNAYKHAFNDRLAGRITVEVLRESPAQLKLTVRDNGTGFDPGDDASGGEGLGRSLIEAFVRQLHGQLEVHIDGGTVVIVRFAAPQLTPGTQAPAKVQAQPAAQCEPMTPEKPAA